MGKNKKAKKKLEETVEDAGTATDDMDEVMNVYKVVKVQADVAKWIFVIEKFRGELQYVRYDKDSESFTIAYSATKYQHYKMVDMAKTMAAWRLEKRQDPKFVQQAVEFYIENR